MLELNLRCPAILRDQDSATQIEFLETFWDSGCARFGEEGAPGWDRWLEAKGEVAASKMMDKGWYCDTVRPLYNLIIFLKNAKDAT